MTMKEEINQVFEFGRKSSFDEYLEKAGDEFKKYKERDDRADLDGALEHLRNVSFILNTAIEEVNLCRKRVSIELFYRNRNNGTGKD